MHILAFQGFKDTLQVCISGRCSAGETKFCLCEHVETYFCKHFTHVTTQAIAKTDKALLEARCFNNATLVHHAAAGGQEEVILYLLEALGEDLLGELHKPCLPRNPNQDTRSHKFIRSSATRIRAQPSECAHARNLEICTLQRIDFCVHTTQRLHKCALTRRARSVHTDEVDRNGANSAHWAARSNKISVLKLICDKNPGLLVAKNRDGKGEAGTHNHVQNTQTHVQRLVFLKLCESFIAHAFTHAHANARTHASTHPRTHARARAHTHTH
jgi:ankyrin repeat protein